MMGTNQIDDERSMTEDTALIQINPGIDERVVALAGEVEALLRRAEGWVILTITDAKGATEDLGIIAGLKKALEDKRKEYVSPLNGYVKEINAAFKDFTDPLDKADKVIRSKVLAYRAEQERQRQEQDRINRLREEAARAEMELKGELSEPVGLVEVAPEPPTHYRTPVGMSGVVRTWAFEVIDFALLPDHYKVADAARIRKMVQAGGTIPGVRTWQEETLRVTTG